MKKFTVRHRLATLVAAGVVLTGSGIAYGFWGAGGSGTGTAATGTAEEVGLIATPHDPAARLTPGGAPVLLDINVDNHVNTFPVSLLGKVLYMGSVTCGGSPAPRDWFAFAQPVIQDTTEVPSGYGVPGYAGFKLTATGVTVQMVESGSNQDQCTNNQVQFNMRTDTPYP